MINPLMLVILDGFGYRSDHAYNAIAQAHTPCLDMLLQHYPHTLLQASGTTVGLPAHCKGNSEVGHLTIGAGRIVEQPFTRLNTLITNNELYTNPLLQENLQTLRAKKGNLHIIGLLAHACTHAAQKHIYAFLDVAQAHGIHTTYLHLILDGRDTAPQSASLYLQHLESQIASTHYGIIGSLHGRFYAMDRNKNWDRTAKSYNVLTKVQQNCAPSWEYALDHSYKQHITDEFFIPTQLNRNAIINDNDGIIFCNWRSDRAWQLAAPFITPSFNYFPTKKIALTFFITPTQYHKVNTTALLLPLPTKNTLKDVLAAHQKKIVSIAESEKFAHVTYFFRAEVDGPVANEIQQKIESKNITHYENVPEMSAPEITQFLLHSLRTNPADFYLVNYANADMVGHSGNLNATVKAVEAIDEQLQKLYTLIVLQMNGTLLITGDHGNAEDMFNPETNQPRTAHTSSPVPFIYINQSVKNTSPSLPLTQLADIAPFILHLMKIPVPAQMHTPDTP